MYLVVVLMRIVFVCVLIIVMRIVFIMSGLRQLCSAQKRAQRIQCTRHSYVLKH